MYSANGFAPRISLKGANNIGQVVLFPNGSAVLQPSMANGQVHQYYHLDNFHITIDLLKNETSMYLLYSGSGGCLDDLIKTTQELVDKVEVYAHGINGSKVLRVASSSTTVAAAHEGELVTKGW